MNKEIIIPAGFKQVAKAQFYKELYADKRDIMPKLIPGQRQETWETRDRTVWGWSHHGYDPLGRGQVYALKM